MYKCEVFSNGEVLSYCYKDYIFSDSPSVDPLEVSDYLNACCNLRIDYINRVIDRLNYEKKCLIDYQQKLYE